MAWGFQFHRGPLGTTLGEGSRRTSDQSHSCEPCRAELSSSVVAVGNGHVESEAHLRVGGGGGQGRDEQGLELEPRRMLGTELRYLGDQVRTGKCGRNKELCPQAMLAAQSFLKT